MKQKKLEMHRIKDSSTLEILIEFFSVFKLHKNTGVFL